MWPIRIRYGRLTLRPLRRRDFRAWTGLRRANAAWLNPWEATVPAADAQPAMTFGQYVRETNRAARAGHTRPWVVEYDGEMVGQVTVSGITRGSLSSAAIGYWISRHVAGQGITPRAVALAIDDCFTTLGLHRVEINIRPENAASLRVVAKLGLRDEGVRKAYLHIQGAWADHRTFAITSEEVRGPMIQRLEANLRLAEKVRREEKPRRERAEADTAAQPQPNGSSASA